MSADERIMKLRAMWSDAVAKANAAEVAAIEAGGAANAYNLAKARLKAELGVAPGYDVDVLGDGKVKPAGECATKPGAG